jgi:hypothetical protein
VTGDLALLATFATLLVLHEWRAVKRANLLATDHDTMMKQLADNHRIFLAAVGQRHALEVRVATLETKVERLTA